MHTSATAATLRIALIGDYDPTITAHRAIPLALSIAAREVDREVKCTWLDTRDIHSPEKLHGFDGIWCTPGSPYRNMNGALLAIRHARENGTPFLGTCGGFQHALIEYARNFLGWANADHAESAPNAKQAVISALSCSLVEARGNIELTEGSAISLGYGQNRITEGYRCSYGLNPQYEADLLNGPLIATGRDDQGEVRSVELQGHPFFLATLFQPERAALAGNPVPLAKAFVQACSQAVGK